MLDKDEYNDIREDNEASVAEKSCLDFNESSKHKEEQINKRHKKVITTIIIICIVLTIAVGSFVYCAFFFFFSDENLLMGKITWCNEVDGETFYYEFNKDGSFVASIGSVEYKGHYKKTNGTNGKQIGIDISIGSFYSSSSAGNAGYKISGSRILGNQIMTCTYAETYGFTLKQTVKEDYVIELPKDFTPDEGLLGTWIYKNGSEIDKIIFYDDGSMTWEIHEGSMNVTAKYRGIYRVEDTYIFFTYNVGEDITVPWSYTLNGDKLFVLGNEYVREDRGT